MKTPSDVWSDDWQEPPSPNAELQLKVGEVVRNRKRPKDGECIITDIRWDLVDVDGADRRLHRWLIGDVERVTK